MGQRTTSAKSHKPYDGFPLTAHPNGSWVKRCKPPGAEKTRTFYFGPLANWKAALEKFNREWPYIIEGKTPPPELEDGACTLRVLCNLFLESKRNRIASGDLTERSYRDYYLTCERLIEHFGRDRRVDDLRPRDFEGFRAKLAEKMSPVTLGNEINRCRVVLKYASDQRLIAGKVEYGQSFNRPSKRTLRRVRNEAGPKMFTRDELLTILTALEGKLVHVEGEDEPVTLKANPKLRCMVLLGLNAALGNTDISNLHESHIVDGWLNYPRPKTEIQRQIPLWPETRDAIADVLANRKRPHNPDDEGIVFLTRMRVRYVRMTAAEKQEDVVAMDAIAKAFGKLLKRLKINGRRGLGFYTLRRQFEIVAGESKDQVAVDAIMGHAEKSDDMAAVYRQGVVSDERLQAVTEHVRHWLFEGGAT